MMKFVVLVGYTIFIYAGLTEAYSSPGAPQNVRLLADNKNIAVSWDPPTETDGNIRRYIVTWAILPDFQDVTTKLVVDANVTAAFIAINNDVGRLFRIHVRGENKFGVGGYSVPRYIRIGCGNDIMVLPDNDVIVTSPGYDMTLPLKSGVVCKWNIMTDSVYVLSFKIKKINLLNSTAVGQIDRLNCAQVLTYVNVSTVGLFCDAESAEREITTQRSSMIVTLISGLRAGGKGFIFRFRTAVKRPGPPTTVRTKVNKHAMVVSWQPPMERTLPITSYIVQYEIIPDGHAYRIIVAPVMKSFPINTDRWRGKLLAFNVTAMIQNYTGETSPNVYARATCRYEYYLQPGQSINITSPNYPDAYPNGIVCMWSMRSSPEATLRMTYIDFQLEDLPFCSSDYVRFSFKREPDCARMKVPHSYDTDRQEINVTLVTDNVRPFKGFVINILAVQAFSSTRLPTKNGSTNILLHEILNTKETDQSHAVPSTEISEVPPNTRRLSASQTARGNVKELPGNRQFHSTTTKTASPFTSSLTSGLTTDSARYVTSSSFFPRDSTSARNTDLSLSTLISSQSSPKPRVVESASSTLLQSSSAWTSTPASSSAATATKLSIQLISSHSPVSLIMDKSQDLSYISSTESLIHEPLSTSDSYLHPLTEDQSLFTKETIVETLTFFPTSEQTTQHSTSMDKDVTDSDKTSPSKYLIDTVKDKSVQRDDGDDTHDKSTPNVLAPVLLSAGGCIMVVCVVVCLVCRRQNRRRKINVEVHREIQRQMAVFGTFIEDKEALETRLRRRHAHRRTSSF